MKKSLRRTSLLMFAIGLPLTCILIASTKSVPTMTFPVPAVDTPAGRQASVEALQTAWENRQRLETINARDDERAFINHVGRFAYNIRTTREAAAAKALLSRAYREHAEAFPGDK